MLLWLDASLEKDLDASGARGQHAVTGLEYIALGYREGKHLLFADRPLLRLLSSHSELDSRAKASFRRLLEKLPQMGAVRQMPAYRVEVVDSSRPLEASGTGSVKVIRVPITHFRDSCNIQETILLAENDRDVQFYKTLARVYARVNKLGNIQIRARGVGGGGDTTADHYNNYQSSKEQFCLCIVDSDKAAPGDSHGRTARRLASTDDPEQPLCEFLTTESHELENTIPTNVYSEIAVRNADRMKAIEALECIEKSSASEVRNYVDLKNGTKLGALLACSKSSPVRRYWASRLQALVNATSSISEKCVLQDSCTEVNACSCWIVPGIGESALDDVLKHLEELSPRNLEQSLKGEMSSERMRLGEVILAWCCGAQRLSTV